MIIITAECTDEIDREVAKYHNQIADKIEAFLKEKMEWYRDIGFYGSDFSENSLRWQLSTILFRMILGTYAWTTKDAPRTAWGESAFLWLIEKMNTNMAFNFCDIPGKDEDRMYFFDYQKDGKGDEEDPRVEPSATAIAEDEHRKERYGDKPRPRDKRCRRTSDKRADERRDAENHRNIENTAAVGIAERKVGVARKSRQGAYAKFWRTRPEADDDHAHYERGDAERIGYFGRAVDKNAARPREGNKPPDDHHNREPKRYVRIHCAYYTKKRRPHAQLRDLPC